MNGKGVFKGFVALLIALILAAAPVFVYAESDGSSGDNQSSGDSLTATKGTYWFDPHVTGTDLTDNYVYDDALLTGDSLEFSWPLATMTFELAVASISSEREPNTEEGYKNKSRNLKAYLEDNGFVDFDTNDDYKKSMTMTTMGAACAHKKIVDNGTEYTVLAIVPRSAGYEAEWGSNFILGETGDHEGFRLGKEKVLEFAKEYVSKYKISGNIKVWAPGYSRGAGVMELVGAEILRDPQEAIGINVEPENFYCYTYGSPNSAGTDTDYNDDKFKRIHNVYESYDLMTVLPFAKLGFSRCGEEVHYADDSRKQQMLDLLAELNSDVYTKFTTVGDPDNFTLKTIDVDALTNDHQLKFVDDENSYLPDNQREFLDLFNGIALAAFTDRAGYVASSQDAVSELASYYFSHTDKGDAIGAGIMGSKHTIPAMISLYLAYMMERNSETSITSDDKTKLLSWISELKENAGMDDSDSQSGTEDVPEDLTEAVTEFVTAFASAEKFGDLLDVSAKLSSLLTSYVLADALTSAGLDQEDQDLYNKLTSQEYCGALSHVAAYYLLYDE